MYDMNNPSATDHPTKRQPTPLTERIEIAIVLTMTAIVIILCIFGLFDARMMRP